MRLMLVPLCVILAAAAGSCAGWKPAPDDSETATESPAPAGLEGARFLTGAQPFRKAPPSGTFDFVVPFGLPDDPRVDAESAGRRIRESVTRELTRKGYRHGGVDPVFLVKVTLVLDEKVDAFAPVRGDGTASSWVRSIEGSSNFEKGALILDLLDPEDHWSLWRGVCGANILIDASEEEKDERVELIVQRLLKGFPPE